MADECKVFQLIEIRARGQIRPMPPLVYSTLSDEGSLTLNKSTNMITVISSIAGTIDFEATDGTDPTGLLSPYPINANQDYDFGVRPGTKIRFDAP